MGHMSLVPLPSHHVNWFIPVTHTMAILSCNCYNYAHVEKSIIMIFCIISHGII